MPKFLYIYHGQPSSPPSEAEMAEIMKAWTAWFEKLGAAVVDGGAPTGEARTVSAKEIAQRGRGEPGFGIFADRGQGHGRRLRDGQGLPDGSGRRPGGGLPDHGDVAPRLPFRRFCVRVRVGVA